MPADWIQLALGQGGSLIILLVISKAGFKYFANQLDIREIERHKREEKFTELHISTLDHIHALTEEVKGLSDNIKSCPHRKAG
jgi:hypothetical protein